MSWEGAYVGVPFVEGGRDRRGLDCWGLVRLVFRDRLAIDLPLHDEIGPADHRRVTTQMQASIGSGAWQKVQGPRAYDVMVARRDPHSRYPGHVGVMLDSGRVLHVWKGRDVHVSRLREPALAGLIIGFFRHGGGL